MTIYIINQLYFLFINKIIINAPTNPNIAPEAPDDNILAGDREFINMNTRLPITPEII